MEDASELALVDELLDHRDGRDAAVVVPDRVRHTGLLDRGGHRLRFLRVPPERLLAHHHLAGLRRRDRDVVVRVVRARDIDDVDVLAAHEITPVGRVRLVAPVRRELLHPLFVPRGHRLQHGAQGEIEKPWRLQKRIRVGAAHEAVPHQPDIQILHSASPIHGHHGPPP